MKQGIPFERIALLYLPWLLALLFQSDPNLSYTIAWLGSFFIFYLTLYSSVFPLPADSRLGEQVMRPIILVQIIFAGYMCCTSIFYMLSLYGYDNFHQAAFYNVDRHQVELTAQCQRYYLLGHAAMVTGILICTRYPVKKKYVVESDQLANSLFYATIFTLPLSIFFLKFSGLSQFANQFSSLSFMAAALGLAFAIPRKNIKNIVVCATFYVLNFYSALLSGFKEPIILSVLVLGIFLYPNYKKIVLFTFVPALLLLFLVLPTYVGIVRQNSWSGNTSADAASSEAIDAALNKEEVADETTWDFLVSRLSEIEMFTGFVENTPQKIPYYNLQLLKQSVIALVPRAFWPSKPSTEVLVMQRVYDAGIINPYSKVSAKPAYIVDAYLSYGGLGVFIYLFMYGAAAQLISQKAEELFGGYTLGTALIFSGLFQIFWRGLSFEFMFNTVFWSFISMYLIFAILRRIGMIKAL
jgi:hypothetical protein